MKWLLLKIILASTYLVAISPIRFQKFVGDVIGILWFDVLRIRRKVILDNIAQSYPQNTSVQNLEIGRSSMKNLGRAIVDYCLIIHYKREWFDKYFVVEDLSEFDKALKLNKGVLILTGHIGSGDFGTLAITVLGYKVNLISKHFKSKWLDDFWFGVREKNGVKFISHEKSTFQILRTLNRSEVVIFVLDQFMGPPIGVKTKFFGRPTGTAAGLAIFAQKTGAPVVPMYCSRRDDGRLSIRAEKAIPFVNSEDQGDNIQMMTQIYTDKIEEIVRRFPDQWMWVHRRWKDFNDSNTRYS